MNQQPDEQRPDDGHPADAGPASRATNAPPGEIERYLSSQLQTALHQAVSDGDPAPVERLHKESLDQLGPTSAVTLSIECRLEALRSQRRNVSASHAAWEDLLLRARAELDEDNTALMSIALFHARYARMHIGQGGKDAGVTGYEAEWRRRRELFGPDNYLTCVAHANLAVALRERCGESDLSRACRILRREIAQRTERYGANDPFTWSAKTVLAQTLVRVAEVTGVAARAEAALALAAALVDGRRSRYGPTSVAVLKVQLVRAHALLVLGQATAAAAEIRFVQAVSRRTGNALAPGWPEYLLARAQLAAADPAALGTARLALQLREAHFAPNSREVSDARALVEQLEQLEQPEQLAQLEDREPDDPGPPREPS